MFHRRLSPLLIALAVLAMLSIAAPPVRADGISDAVAWYDTLGYPDAKTLPYVRVATGLYSISGNKPPENRFVEGFLVGEEPDGSFTVFVCSVSDFQDGFGMSEPYSPLATIHVVRKTDGPAHKKVDYEVLDFEKVAADVLARVSDVTSGPREFEARRDIFSARYPGLRGAFDLRWGRPLSHRARIFAFARACQQKGLADTAAALFDACAHIPDEQTGKINPALLRDALQQQIGEELLNRTEEEFGNPAISLEELLKIYEPFAARFPASPKVAYAQEAADLLRKMIAEEAAHHPKPLDQMSPAEQVAENIYQLRNLGRVMWVMNEHYPLIDWRVDRKVVTPVHRLVDLGNVAVPQLIAALDDRRFTRCMEERFNGLADQHVMRVGEVAQRTLEHMGARNFYAEKARDGKVRKGTTRQLAEAWWAEVQSKGEKQSLIEATSAGGGPGLMAARKLVEKFPAEALPAIEAGICASAQEGYRGEFVEVAGKLPGDQPLAFLRAQLTPDHGIYSQVSAAEALFKSGHTEAVPAMIESWHRLQPRLTMIDEEAYSEAGRLISFLARTGDAAAIDALALDAKNDPVDVRLAVVEAFLKGGFSGGSIGPSVSIMSVRDRMEKLPDGAAGAAIERLLIGALDDRERRFGMTGQRKEASYRDPRVCDMAAFVLSKRWPEKYAFQWKATSSECDPQVVKMRDQWRSANGLPPVPPPPPPVPIPAAAESEVAPLLDAFAAATDDGARDAVTGKITTTFGLGALPAVRARLEKSGNAAFRPLTVHLASLVREVRVEADAGDSARVSAIGALQGQSLSGERLHRLADELQSTLPAAVRSVVFYAERAGDGAGFKVTVAWRAGEVVKQPGWDRALAVHSGDESLYELNSYMAEGAMKKENIYRGLADALEKARQAQLDGPIVVRVQIQRSGQ